MKFDFLQPHQLKTIMGGDGDNPSCWDNPDDPNDGGIPTYPGGPTIFIPGIPTFGG